MTKKSARGGELVAVETALAKQDAMRSAMLAAYDALQEADSIYEAKNIRLSFELFHEMARLAKNVELQNMAVDPDHRQQGVGRALLEAARDLMLRAGAKRVFLEVRSSNKPAQSLYYSIGFALHSVRRDYYRDPQEDALVLSLELYPPTVLSSI